MALSKQLFKTAGMQQAPAVLLLEIVMTGADH